MITVTCDPPYVKSSISLPCRNADLLRIEFKLRLKNVVNHFCNTPLLHVGESFIVCHLSARQNHAQKVLLWQYFLYLHLFLNTHLDDDISFRFL